MKKFISIFILLFCSVLHSQTKLLSWNLENFGKSKSKIEIEFIVETVHDYDIIAIQEVVAGYGGAQAVAQLADELNRKGANGTMLSVIQQAEMRIKKNDMLLFGKQTSLKK